MALWRHPNCLVYELSQSLGKKEQETTRDKGYKTLSAVFFNFWVTRHLSNSALSSFVDRAYCGILRGAPPGEAPVLDLVVNACQEQTV